MHYYIALVIVGGIFVVCLLWLLKQVHALKETVSTLQQNVINLDYNVQQGWVNTSEKTNRLVKHFNQLEPIITHCVTFKNVNRKLYVTSPKINLLTLAREENIAISTGCYGEGTCGQCAFVPLEGEQHLSPCGEKEERSIQMFNYPKTARLSCQCKVSGNVTVELLQPLGSL